jgi:hypothetical protein
MIEQIPELAQTAAKIVAAGGLLAIPGVAGVTAYHHRELTHRSIKLHPWLKGLINWEMRTYAPIDKLWAAVHRGHHSKPDVDLKGFLDTTRLLDWLGQNPDRVGGRRIPEEYKYLDRYIKEVPKNDVLNLGYQAEDMMIDLLGDEYKRPDNYTDEEIDNFLDPKSYRVYKPRRDKKAPYTQDEIETGYLRDPHSPSLDEESVHGILKWNPVRYSALSRLYRSRPDLLPDDLKIDKVINHKLIRYRGFVESSALIAAGVFGLSLLSGHEYNPQMVVDALAAGTAINTVKLIVHIAGGSFTNAWGHAGEINPIRFFRATVDKNYRIIPNPEEGTVSTNGDTGGLLAEGLGKITFDEANRQKDHHFLPWLIEYTTHKGLRAWRDAPWGMFLKTMAESRFVPFIQPGEGFDLKEGEIRPDMPGPAVQYIHELRKKQIKQEKLEAVAA